MSTIHFQIERVIRFHIMSCEKIRIKLKKNAVIIDIKIYESIKSHIAMR